MAIIRVKLENGKEYRKFTSDGRIEVKTKRIVAHWNYPVWSKVASERIKNRVEKAIQEALKEHQRG